MDQLVLSRIKIISVVLNVVLSILRQKERKMSDKQSMMLPRTGYILIKIEGVEVAHQINLKEATPQQISLLMSHLKVIEEQVFEIYKGYIKTNGSIERK